MATKAAEKLGVFSKLTPEVIKKTEKATPSKEGRVKFILDRETLCDAEIMMIHHDRGFIQLDLLVQMQNSRRFKPFMRVRAAKLSDREDMVAGVWFIE